MKTIKYISLLLIAILGLSSCQDDDYEVGTPFNKVEGVMGDWSVKSVLLMNEAGEQMDITSYFDFATFKINFKDNNTFEVTGNAPDFIGMATGTWSLDDAEAPMTVLLKNGDAKSQFGLVAPPRKGTNLKIKYVRMVGDEAIATYIYELSQN